MWNHLDMGGWGWFGMGFGFLGMVLFWALVIVFVVWLVRRVGEGHSGADRNEPTAKQILEQRYARGEIDRDEYLERKRTLDGV